MGLRSANLRSGHTEKGLLHHPTKPLSEEQQGCSTGRQDPLLSGVGGWEERDGLTQLELFVLPTAMADSVHSAVELQW